MSSAVAPRTQRQQPAAQRAAVPFDVALTSLSVELDRRQAIIEQSAASLIDPVKLKGVVLSTFTRTPALWECDPVSIARAVVEAAQAGLEPTGSLGGAFLVPFFNSKTGRKEAQLIIGYTGLVKLARRSGEVIKVEARVVRQQDEFDYGYGLDPYLNHRPALGLPEDAQNPMTHAYAVAWFRSGERQFDVMSAAEILAIKARSKAKDSGPWVTDEAEMWKKTVLRRMSKLMPLTIEAQRALDAEETDLERSARARPVGPTRPAPSRIASRITGSETTSVPASGGAGTTTGAPAAHPAAPAAASSLAPTSSGPGEDDAAIDGEVVESSDVIAEGVNAGELRQWLRDHGIEQTVAREACMRLYRVDSFDAITDEQRGHLILELDAGIQR